MWIITVHEVHTSGVLSHNNTFNDTFVNDTCPFLIGLLYGCHTVLRLCIPYHFAGVNPKHLYSLYG